MKILSIVHKEHFVPKSGSGTGYSEPDYFTVNTDEGSFSLCVDIWYLYDGFIKKRFMESLKKDLKKEVSNKEEAYNMYVEALRKTDYCPYSLK